MSVNYFLGKNWILQHTTDSPKCNVILQYLLKKYAHNFIEIPNGNFEYIAHTNQTMWNSRQIETHFIAYLYRALINVAPFTQKLHLIYLVNDVLHHWWVFHSPDLSLKQSLYVRTYFYPQRTKTSRGSEKSTREHSYPDVLQWSDAWVLNTNIYLHPFCCWCADWIMAYRD